MHRAGTERATVSAAPSYATLESSTSDGVARLSSPPRRSPVAPTGARSDVEGATRTSRSGGSCGTWWPRKCTRRRRRWPYGAARGCPGRSPPCSVRSDAGDVGGGIRRHPSPRVRRPGQEARGTRAAPSRRVARGWGRRALVADAVRDSAAADLGAAAEARSCSRRPGRRRRRSRRGWPSRPPAGSTLVRLTRGGDLDPLRRAEAGGGHRRGQRVGRQVVAGAHGAAGSVEGAVNRESSTWRPSGRARPRLASLLAATRA